MPATYRWWQSNGQDSYNSQDGTWNWFTGTNISAPESVRRIIFRGLLVAAQQLVNPSENYVPGPKVYWVSCQLVTDIGEDVPYIGMSPMPPTALFLPAGSSTTPAHSFYWTGQPLHYDADVHKAAPPPPGSGLNVNFQMLGQNAWSGGPPFYVSSCQYWWTWDIRVLISSPG